jgi:hypothetical protein
LHACRSTLEDPLNIERCRAGMAGIVREKWGPNWESGIKAFLASIGAL